jgi:hypothetical protein
MSTAGAGTAGHFAGEMFIAMAGIKPVVVHYKGGGPAIEAVVDNDSQWTVAPIGGRMPHVRTGKLKALAMGSPTRLALLPNVPTVAEFGYPGYNAVGWGAIFVPNGTPQPIITTSSTPPSPRSSRCRRSGSNSRSRAPRAPAAPKPKWQSCFARTTPASANWRRASGSA